MSLRRKTNPNELWTDPNEPWTDPNEFDSLYDRLSSLCGELPSDILSLFPENQICELAAVLLKNYETSGFFQMALELLQKLDEDRPRISGDEFSTLVCQVWLNPKFAHGLRSVIEKNPDLIGFVTAYANQDCLPTDRMARMEADPCFKPCLMAIKSAPRKIILRVFLSILIGYWSDKGHFTELDKRMGKDFFGRRMEKIAKIEAMAIACAGKEEEIEDLSFEINDISDVKDLEPLRQLLVSRYGGGGAIDVEDILEKAKENLSYLLNISLKHLGYGGKKAKIKVSLCDGSYDSAQTISW